MRIRAVSISILGLPQIFIMDSLLQTQDRHATSKWMKMVSHLHVTHKSLAQEVLHFPSLSFLGKKENIILKQVNEGLVRNATFKDS